MKILLDTHIAIWAVLDSEELSNTARAMILDENNEIYYSTASTTRQTDSALSLLRPRIVPFRNRHGIREGIKTT